MFYKKTEAKSEIDRWYQDSSESIGMIYKSVQEDQEPAITQEMIEKEKDRQVKMVADILKISTERVDNILLNIWACKRY